MLFDRSCKAYAETLGANSQVGDGHVDRLTNDRCGQLADELGRLIRRVAILRGGLHVDRRRVSVSGRLNVSLHGLNIDLLDAGFVRTQHQQPEHAVLFDHRFGVVAI